MAGIKSLANVAGLSTIFSVIAGILLHFTTVLYSKNPPIEEYLPMSMALALLGAIITLIAGLLNLSWTSPNYLNRGGVEIDDQTADRLISDAETVVIGKLKASATSKTAKATVDRLIKALRE